MRTYSQKSRSELALSTDDWEELRAFLDEARPIITTARNQADIEAPPPRLEKSNPFTEEVFAPGGWVGQYPADIYVYPDKLTKDEYRQMLRDIAGWIELWDLPTAAAVLPLYQSNVNDERTVVLGYSAALRDFTEETLAQRPAVNVQRVKEAGSQPRGAIDFQQTIHAQAEGRNEVVYSRLQFSFDHPLNQLLVRFHAELESALANLLSHSQLMETTLREHQQYHRTFLESQFSDKLVQQSLEQGLSTLLAESANRRDIPGKMTELIDLCESYLQRQALAVDFTRQLTLGLKPASKLYELWVLTEILVRLEEMTGYEPIRRDQGLARLDVGPDCVVHYNRAVTEHSRFLAAGLDTYPGRPDYALEVDGEIVWIGDAKYSPVCNIGLDSYQRLLSYAADLMPTTGPSTAAILHVDRSADQQRIQTNDYHVSEFAIRPTDQPSQLFPSAVTAALPSE